MRSKDPSGLSWPARSAIAALDAALALLPGTAAATTGGAATPGGAHRRRAAPPAPPPAAPSAGAISLVSAETAPRKSFYFGYRFPRLSYTIGSTQPQNDLQIDVVDSAGEVVKTFYREDVAPDVPTSPLGRDHRTKAGRPATAATASASARSAGSDAGRPQGDRLDHAQPRLLLLRLRLPDPRPARIQHGRRPLRRRPLRPHPPGPGRDGRLRHAAGCRPRRHRPVRRLPGRRRQLRRDRRQGHPQRLHVRAPGRTLAAARPAKPSAPASRSGSSARPATPPPATCISRSGDRPAGTKAAPPSTPSPTSKSGTPTAEPLGPW